MYDHKKVEQDVRKFWEDHKIFEKSLEAREGAKRFVFWEGPPTANGLPHTGHFLTRIYKDLYGRYKTMRGFFVLRKAGWDTHGLPVEIEVEKELGFKNKKQVEEYGIAQFNRKARESVWKYKDAWEQMTKKMGFWLDLKDPYITYETKYTESVWHILEQIWNKGLLFKAHRVVPFCVRCGTPLSAHEVAQGYKKVTDRSVYIKFRVKNQPNTYILAWTTTPWTLPGNVALAVGSAITYLYAKKDGQTFIVAKDLAEKVLGPEFSTEKEVQGSELVGLEYEPLFEVKELQSETSYKVYAADFVSTTDGTGVVHTAVMYGEDDYNLGTKLNLPKFHTVDEQGKFVPSTGSGLSGKYVKAKETEDLIIQKLMADGYLLKSVDYEHDYPFCWRCGTPLLYYAKTSWFIRTSAVNKDLLANNSTVNWIPEHIKEGRFGEWLRAGKDWALSRERYWGTPLPIWECDQCDNQTMIGSIKDLEKLSIGSKNTYYVMRHGHSTRKEDTEMIINSRLESDHYHLTDRGRNEVERSMELLKMDSIDFIYTSPFLRTKETAEIGAKMLHKKVEEDERLGEWVHRPELEGQSEKVNTDIKNNMENYTSIRKRLFDFVSDLEAKHKNKNILIVTHGAPAWFLEAIGLGYTNAQIDDPQFFKYTMPALAEVRKINWRKIPRNEYGELDLHRPFIDEVKIKCSKCKSKMHKIPDLIDVWFDSGSMPYAQWHYPFENKSVFKQQFPADFIVEGMDQTRGWFWTLLAISTLLGKGAPYKTVMALGFTLDEKGVKESKSKGNYVPITELMDKHGVDVLRWYFGSTMAIGENKMVIQKEMEAKLKGFIFTLQNCIKFYELYAKEAATEPTKLNTLDKWILSRLHRLIGEVTVALDKYDPTVAGRAIEYFVIEDLSNWWLRRSRKRKEALPLLRLILLEVAKLLAPFTPFLAEDIHMRLRGEKESVHLNDWPKFHKKFVNDKLESEMNRVKQVIAAGLAQRKEKQFKVRQPLASVSLKGDKFSKDLESLIQDELNIKKVKYNKSQETEIELDFELTGELIGEGFAREAMRQIQDMRKEAKYKIDDMVTVHWHTFDNDVAAAMEKWSEDIKTDTVLSHFERHRKDGMAYDIEKETELSPGKKIWLGIKK